MEDGCDVDGDVDDDEDSGGGEGGEDKEVEEKLSLEVNGLQSDYGERTGGNAQATM